MLKKLIIKKLNTRMINFHYHMNYKKRPAKWLKSPFFLVHIPKAAGKAISASVNLKDPGHVLFCDMSPNIRKVLAKKPCVAVIRDPVDRIISTFRYAHKFKKAKLNSSVLNFAKSNDINDFVDQLSKSLILEHYFLKPSTIFIDSAKKAGADVTIIDFKNLNVELNHFFKKINIQSNCLSHINVSKDDDELITDLTEKSYGIIRELYSDDLELLKKFDFTD